MVHLNEFNGYHKIYGERILNLWKLTCLCLSFLGFFNVEAYLPGEFKKLKIKMIVLRWECIHIPEAHNNSLCNLSLAGRVRVWVEPQQTFPR